MKGVAVLPTLQPIESRTESNDLSGSIGSILPLQVRKSMILWCRSASGVGYPRHNLGNMPCPSPTSYDLHPINKQAHRPRFSPARSATGQDLDPVRSLRGARGWGPPSIPGEGSAYVSSNEIDPVYLECEGTGP